MAKSQIDKLMELKQLYERGILTKEEMEIEKKKILGESSKEEQQPINPSQPEIENPSVDIPKEANVVIDEKESFFQKYKTYFFIGIGLLIAGSIYLFYSNVIKKESSKPPTPAEQIRQIEADLDNMELGDLIVDALKIVKNTNSNELITFLTKNGFKPDGKGDDSSSAIWNKTFIIGDSRSDAVSVYWNYFREQVYLVISCKEDATMDKWINVIKMLGYNIEESSDGGDKTLSFSKKNDEGGLIQYDSSSKEKSINIITNFESIGETAETNASNDDNDSYSYKFTGKINGSKGNYSFKMALNINDNGNASGYYIVTNGANERVLLKGSVTNWADNQEGEITLYEYDEAKNSKTGYYFKGDLRIEYSDRGSFAGYSINGTYKNGSNVNWPFSADVM